MKRIIICGGRDWTDGEMIRQVMWALREKGPYTAITGGARGADAAASSVALMYGLDEERYPADWNLPLPKWQIGRERNQRMLDTGVDEVVAFKDGFNHKLNKGGTEHMIKIAVLADVPAVLYAHDLGTPHTFAPHEDEADALAARLQRLRESGDTPTLWEHMRDPDVPVTGVPFPPSQAAPPR